MTLNFEVIQGDTSPILRLSVNGYPVLDGDWTGKLAVLTELGSIPLIDRAITHDTVAFTAALTPAETSTLPYGERYIWVVEIANTTLVIPINKELQYTLSVQQEALV